MFSKSKPTPDPVSAALSPPARAAAPGARQSTFSVLGGDVIVKGDISASVDLHLDGRVEGDVSCASLVQGHDSVIHGAVKAESARLAGTVEGSIVVRDLVIQASAKIIGDVTYQNLTIEQGSQVEGRFSHRYDTAPAPALQAVPSEPVKVELLSKG